MPCEVVLVRVDFFKMAAVSMETVATAAIFNLFNPQQLPHTTVDIPTKFHEV
jgi:hypothetical protein